MSLVTVQGGCYAPLGWVSGNSDAPLDTATKKKGTLFQVPKTGVLDKCEFHTDLLTAVAAGSVVRVSFQNVGDLTSEPDGALDQYRDISGAALTPGTHVVPGLMTSDGTDTGSKRSVLRGERLAALVEYQSFNAGDSLGLVSGGHSAVQPAFPRQLYFDGSVWQRDGNITPSPVGPVAFLLKYDDGTYESVSPEASFSYSSSTYPFTNVTNPDEVGLAFSFPFPVSVRGIIIFHGTTGAPSPYDVTLYDSDGSTALETFSIAPTDVSDAGGQGRTKHDFSGPIDLNANELYRVTMLATSGSPLGLPYVFVPSAAYVNALPGGPYFYQTERQAAGAWTDTPTKCPSIILRVDRFEEFAGLISGGAGGSALDRGFSRGMVT